MKRSKTVEEMADYAIQNFIALMREKHINMLFTSDELWHKLAYMDIIAQNFVERAQKLRDTKREQVIARTIEGKHNV